MSTIAVDWGNIARHHAEEVYRAARRVAPDEDTAWDCVQEALLTALRNRRRGEGIEDPVGWLCGVAKNHARHATRARGRFRHLLHRLATREDARKTAPPARPVSEASEPLNDALARLPASLRDAVILRHLAGMSIPAIAKAQGVSESAAKVRVHRGLAKLRRILGPAALLLLLTDATAKAADTGALLAAVASAGAAAAAKPVPAIVALAASATAKTVAIAAAIVLAVGAAIWTANGPAPKPPAPPGAPPPGAVAHVPGEKAGDPGDTLVATALAATAANVRTVVRDEDGTRRPVPGVRLRVVPASTPLDARTMRSPDEIPVTTDAEGEAAVPFPPGSRVRILLRDDLSYSLAGAAYFAPDLPAEGGAPVEILCVRRGVASGVVLGPDGEPVAGATVRFASAGVEPTECFDLGLATAKTAADGSFRLASVPAGFDLCLVASGAPHRKSCSEPFRLAPGGEATGLVVRLAPGHAITGRVVDGEGAPVAGAVVHAQEGWMIRSGPALLPDAVETDVDGRYRLTGLKARAWTVVAEKDGFLPATFDGVLATRDGAVAPELVIRRGRAVSGVVVDRDGEPVAGAVVSVHGLAAAYRNFGQTRTNGEGRFEVSPLRPGRVRIYAGAPDRGAIEPMELDFPEEPLRIVLGEGRLAVTGVVLDATGEPAPGAIVQGLRPGREDPSDVIADEEGRFRFLGLAAGEMTLTVRREGDWAPVTVSTGTRDVVLRPQKRCVIAGRVVRPDGSVPAHARVRIRVSGTDRMLAGESVDEAGRFRFEDLLGEHFRIEAREQGFLPGVVEDVSGGEENLLVRLREGLTLSGTVRFGGERPEPIHLRATRAGLSVSAGVADDGTFRIAGLEPGRWTLRIQAPAWIGTFPDVEAGTAGLTLSVPDLEALPLASVRFPVPEEMNGAWWASLWAALDDRDVRDGKDLAAALAELLPEGVDRRLLPTLLRRMGDGGDTAVRLFEHPSANVAEALQPLSEVLLEVDDPRIGPAAMRWFDWLVEHRRTSWVTMNPLTAILARHGGEAGAALFRRIFRGEAGGQARNAAAAALAQARDARFLEVGLEALAGPLRPSERDEISSGLVVAFGADAANALLEIVRDDERPIDVRRAALAGLASHTPPAFVGRLREIPVEGDGALLSLELIRRRPKCRTAPPSAAELAELRERATKLLRSPLAPIRLHAAVTVSIRDAYHTPAMLEAVEAAAEGETYPDVRLSLGAAATAIRKDLEGR